MSTNLRSFLDVKTLALPFALAVFLVFSSQISFLLFHTLAELFAIFVAMLTAVVVWQMYAFTRNHFLMYLGCGYFWIALLDMMHTLVYKGMSIFAVTGTEVAVQFWIGTRYLEAILLLTAPWFLSHSLKRNLVFSLFSIGALVLLMLIMSGNFPVGFIEGKGLTAFKVYSEYVIIGILALSVVFLTRQRRLMDRRVFMLMIASITLTMMAELAFTFYVSAYGLSNLAGHIFKLFSFWLIFVAVIRTTLREPFSALSKVETHYDAVPDAAVIIDEKGIIQHVNRAACLLANKTIVELIGLNSHDVYHRKNVSQNACPVCQSIINKKDLSGYEMEVDDNTWRDFSTSNIQGENSFIEVVRDITSKVSMASALGKSEAHLKTLIETLPDLVWLKDPKGVYLSCNEKFEHLYGAKEDEILGKTDYDFVDKELADFVRAKDNIAIDKGASSVNEEEVTYASDGHKELVETIKTPMFTAGGKLVGVLGIARDISERKKMENALQKNKDALLRAQEIAKIGSWKLNPKTKKVEGSKEFLIIFGFSDGEFTLEDFLTVVHPLDRERNLEQIQNGIENGMAWEIEHRLLLDDGSVKWVRAIGDPIVDKHGNVNDVVGTVQDITAQKDADEVLHRSQKMDALGKLTGGIAHDFNNMLGVILGYTELLEGSVGEHTDLSKYIAEIRHAGERGANLTKKLLSFSSKKEDVITALNLNSLLRNQQNMLEKSLTVRIKLDIDFGKDLWPVLINDGEMEDAILNLSINAMYAMESHGQLTIQTRNQTLTQTDAKFLNLPPGDYVLLSVTDTGCGMDEITKEKIFEPFFTTKGEKGTGLGLSQVYGFVQRSSGAIKVYSELDHGTRFALYFPRYHVDEHGESLVNDNVPTPTKSSAVILVVDDEPALLNLTGEMLKQHGFTILSAESAKQALDILEHESIDLMVTDLIMPEMDGYQLVSIVEEKYPALKIQLASGFADDRNEGMVDEALRQNILHKPFNSQALLQRVHALLSEKE